MDLRTLLEKFSEGQLTIDEVQKQITIGSIQQVNNNLAQLDFNREIRKEVPEVIFAKGKEYGDILQIITAGLKRNGQLVVSKIHRKDLHKLCYALRKKRNIILEVGKKSSTILITDKTYPARKSHAKIGILAAGTSDIGIAEEARLMSKAMGCVSVLGYDIGIAGMHRLFPAIEQMISENVEAIVVVAGMEGALASVVSSMVNIPVIGVPTSVGYGFGSGGFAALASMLQSCTFGLAVVNIDNGIGAGAFAALISNRMARKGLKNSLTTTISQSGAKYDNNNASKKLTR
jgi:NCAIR mutase (PurE)-related protein